MSQTIGNYGLCYDKKSSVLRVHQYNVVTKQVNLNDKPLKKLTSEKISVAAYHNRISSNTKVAKEVLYSSIKIHSQHEEPICANNF